MRWLRTSVVLLLVASPASAQAPGASCEETLTALTYMSNSLVDAVRSAQGKDAKIKKLQAELDKLKNPPAPSTPKAPGAGTPGQ